MTILPDLMIFILQNIRIDPYCNIAAQRTLLMTKNIQWSKYTLNVTERTWVLMTKTSTPSAMNMDSSREYPLLIKTI